jgi:hypothetical protein
MRHTSAAAAITIVSEHSFGSLRCDLVRSQAEQLCHDLIGVAADAGPGQRT